jgi:hypothetical protein
LTQETSLGADTVTFHRLFLDAPPPLRGDRAALGTLPAAAFQYCEPVRAASSFGWYIFPPIDARLRWDGAEIFYASEGEWCKLTSIHLTDDFVEHWDANAPGDLKGYWPPFMTALPQSGLVQIWSGLLVSTAANWSLLIGPIPNLVQTRQFSCFEGLVETDTFRPLPLFINLRLQSTDQEILIPRDKPLFFVRPIRRECYSEAVLTPVVRDGVDSMTEPDWVGYRGTIRKVDTPPEEYNPGRYAAAHRKRARRETE